MTNGLGLSFARRVTLASLGVALAAFGAGAGCTDDAAPAEATPGEGSDGGAGEDAPVASTCTPPTGEGTVHSGSLASDSEVWTEAASPHVIDFGLTIREGQSLTIEPCAVVRIRKGQGVLVEGKLLAEGAADKPIAIERADAADPWSRIEVRGTADVRLAHVSIDGGGFANGDRLDEFAMLDVRGDQDLPPQGLVHVDHVALRGSASLGLLLREGGALAGTSAALTVTGSASYPASSWARSAGSIPPGTYTGNENDAIILAALTNRDAIKEDVTFANRGVPYFVRGAQITVGGAGGSVATLTIEAGVTMRFAKGSRLLLDAPSTSEPAIGALRAVGTAEAPIVFTSAEAAPRAGDWVGITLKGTPAPNGRIDHAKIAYAGGSSGISSYDCPSPANQGFTNEGAVIVFGGQPAAVFVTNTAIEDSAGDGIIRGWTGDPLDFLSSNTFARVGRCTQTFPKSSTAACPNPAPCPKG